MTITTEPDRTSDNDASDKNKSDNATLPTIVLGTGANDADSNDPGPLDHLTAARRATLEGVLPKYLQSQRWFGGKARKVERVVIDDWGKLPGRCGAIWTVLDVRFADSGSHRYLLPLTLSFGDAAARIYERARSSVVAFVARGDDRALLHDALVCDDVCAALLNAIGNEQTTATEHGEIWGLSTEVFADLRGDAGRPPPTPHLGPATSSNSLVFYGKRMLLKLFRRSTEGVNPDFEIGRFLTERGEFRRVPRMAGALEYHRDGEEPTTLAIVQETMTHRGDGWEHALEVLGRYYDRTAARRAGLEAPQLTGPQFTGPEADHRTLVELSEASAPPTAREAIGGYLHVATILGRQTAELHTALAADFADPAFAPEPLEPQDLDHLREEVARQKQQALAQLGATLNDLDGATRDAARRLIEEQSNAGSERDDSTNKGSARNLEALKIRCHGDYHLGQVLWSGQDFLILDFEGEPSRSAAERKAKQSPLKDVAGMLRSYHYAAYAGLFTHTQGRASDSTGGASDDFAALEPWAELWRQWVSAAFLGAYRRTLRGRGIVPDDPQAFSELLDGFMLEKAFYELSYELNNRPTWVRIPLRGIIDLTAN